MSFLLGGRNLLLGVAFTAATTGIVLADAEPRMPNFFPDPFEKCDAIEPPEGADGNTIEKWGYETRKLQEGVPPSELGFTPGTKGFKHPDGAGVIEPSGKCTIYPSFGLG